MSTHVRILLESKGAKVETIPASASVADAADRLAARRIGALVVSDDGQAVQGILSERDIIHHLSLQGAACLDLTVDAIMTREVVTCTPDDTTDDMMRIMTEKRFRHIPVVVDGALSGIVSIGDVVKARMNELETATASLEEYVTGSGY